MKKLPLWVLTNKFPAFYDTESSTALEQTAKVYGAMQELIKEYNAFAESFNGAVDEFEAKYKADFEVFTTQINQQFSNLAEVFDLKFRELSNTNKSQLDTFIAEAENSLNAFKSSVREEMIQLYNDFDIIMESKFNQFTTTVNETIAQQNEKIAQYDGTIESTTRSVLTELLNNGEISIPVVYNSADESLNIG